MKQTKDRLAELRAAMLEGNHKKAIAIAARFQQLGKQKEDITRALNCYLSPNMYRELGFDLNETIQKGVEAIRKRWKIPVR